MRLTCTQKQSRIRVWSIAIATALCCTCAMSQQVKVISSEGTDMKFGLGYNIYVNKNSTAKRVMHKVIDEKAPVKLVGDQRFDVQYKTGRGSSGDYIYVARATPVTEKDAVAIEILHSVFDIFGRHVRTLQSVSVEDVQAGNTLFPDGGEWRIFSEAEASMAHSVFSYVSHARFKDGTVYSAPMPAILAAIRKMSPTATEEQISPPKTKQ